MFQQVGLDALEKRYLLEIFLDRQLLVRLYPFEHLGKVRVVQVHELARPLSKPCLLLRVVLSVQERLVAKGLAAVYLLTLDEPDELLKATDVAEVEDFLLR